MNKPTPEIPQIQRAKENIGALKAAIRKEKATIVDYKDRLRTGRGGFPTEGLRNGMARCSHNIEVLRGAILRERANISNMQDNARDRKEIEDLREGFEIPVEYVNTGEDESEEVH